LSGNLKGMIKKEFGGGLVIFPAHHGQGERREKGSSRGRGKRGGKDRKPRPRGRREDNLRNPVFAFKKLQRRGKE